MRYRNMCLFVATILAAASAVCAGEASASPPIITIRKGAADLQNASVVTGFTDISTGSLASGRTEVALAFDEANLFIAFKCYSPVPPKATVKERDGQVWEDDAVEVFLDPTDSRSDYYQFIGNAAGAMWDSRGRDGSWNAKWEYAATVEKGFWTATFKIPFAALGVKAPADGATWGLNLCRDQQTPVKEISSWAIVEDGFHNPGQFGHLLFDRKGAAVRILSVGSAGAGFIAEIEAGQNPVEFNAVLRTVGATQASPLQAKRIEPGAKEKIEITQKISTPGSYSLAWGVKDMKTGKMVSSGEERFKVLEPLSVSLRKYFLSGLRGVDVSEAGLEKAPGMSARVEIGKPGAPPAVTASITEFDQKRSGSASLNVYKVPPGD